MAVVFEGRPIKIWSECTGWRRVVQFINRFFYKYARIEQVRQLALSRSFEVSRGLLLVHCGVSSIEEMPVLYCIPKSLGTEGRRQKRWRRQKRRRRQKRIRRHRRWRHGERMLRNLTAMFIGTSPRWNLSGWRCIWSLTTQTTSFQNGDRTEGLHNQNLNFFCYCIWSLGFRVHWLLCMPRSGSQSCLADA